MTGIYKLTQTATLIVMVTYLDQIAPQPFSPSSGQLFSPSADSGCYATILLCWLFHLLSYLTE